MSPTDLLAGALLGGAVVYAVLRAVISAATVDAMAKRAAELDADHRNHRERLVTLETTQHEHAQRIEGVSRHIGYEHGSKRR